MTADQLDREVRDELRVLARPVAETVAKRLVAAGRLLDEDPEEALAHAVAARRLASRIAVVREAAGLAAYRAGQWQTAIAELRTYQRMSGKHSHLAVLADCERALGRPDRAVDVYRSAPHDQLTQREAIELLIVAAGARADLGQHEAALAMLQVSELTREDPAEWVARLRYAYADALLAVGRTDEARDWFARAAEHDEDASTDAAERLLELDGVVLDEAATEAAAEAAEPSPEATAEPTAERGPQPATGSDLVPGRLVDHYDLILLDLDGVVYLGEQAVPGAVETIVRLRQDGHRLMFVTNNASRSAAEVAALLSNLGVPAETGDVLTAAMVAADRLAALVAPGSAVLVVGTEALVDEIRRVGLRPVRHAEADPAAVVQGYGPQVGWAELAEAAVAVRSGAQWVVTNLDTTLPTTRGPLPGNGALVAALRTALGREPDLVVGKPEPVLFTSAAQRTGARRALVVGDRLDTDIDGARRAGMDSLLVLTGVDGEAEAAARPPSERPVHIGADLTVLLDPVR